MREQVQRRRCLLEGRPEDCRENKKQEDDQNALSLTAVEAAGDEHVKKVEERHRDDDEGHALGDGDRIDSYHARHGEHYDQCQYRNARCHDYSGTAMLGGIGRGRPRTQITEGFVGASPISENANEHAHTRRAKAEVPGDFFAQIAGDERSDEGTEVDAHVEDRESGVAPRSAFRIQVSDDGRDVGLEQSGAEHDQNQADEKRRVGEDDGKRDRQVAEGDENSTVPDCPPEAEQSVGDPSTRQRRQINAGGVNTDNRAGRLSGECESAGSERRRHEQDQQRPYSVEREPLPHLGEEESGEAYRLPKKSAGTGAPLNARRRFVMAYGPR